MAPQSTLCKCGNDDYEEFLQTQSEESGYQQVFCKICQEEISAKKWHEALDRKLSSRDGSAGNGGTASNRLPPCTERQQESLRREVRDLEEGVRAMVTDLRCPCGSMDFRSVKGAEYDKIKVCNLCDNLLGVDDSFFEESFMDLLQDTTRKAHTTPCIQCGNTDKFKYEFVRHDGEMRVRCMKCKTYVPWVDENSNEDGEEDFLMGLNKSTIVFWEKSEDGSVKPTYLPGFNQKNTSGKRGRNHTPDSRWRKPSEGGQGSADTSTGFKSKESTKNTQPSAPSSMRDSWKDARPKQYDDPSSSWYDIPERTFDPEEEALAPSFMEQEFAGNRAGFPEQPEARNFQSENPLLTPGTASGASASSPWGHNYPGESTPPETQSSFSAYPPRGTSRSSNDDYPTGAHEPPSSVPQTPSNDSHLLFDSGILCYCGNKTFSVGRSSDGVRYCECCNCLRSHTLIEWQRLMSLPPVSELEVPPRAAISQLEDLHPADHIAWYEPLGYEHHAIVKTVDIAAGSIEVYEFTGGPGQKLNAAIETSWRLNPEKGLLYRLDYNPTDCLTVQEVLERAQSRVGRKSYNLAFNNCEHYATWCKTGKSLSSQVTNFARQARHAGNTAMKLAGYDKFSQVVSSAVNSMNPKKGLSSVGKSAVRFDVGDVAEIEMNVLANNLHKYERAHREGHITSAAYADFGTAETAQTITKVAATGLGTLASFAFGISPRIGETVGYVVGQAVAPAAGRGAVRLSRGLSK